MDLKKNQLTSRIPEFQSNLLQTIYLNDNRLYGPIPYSIFELVNLTKPRLFSNNLSGMVELDMFAKLKNLYKLDLYYNNLLLSTDNKVNSSFLKLSLLDLLSCK